MYGTTKQIEADTGSCMVKHYVEPSEAGGYEQKYLDSCSNHNRRPSTLPKLVEQRKQLGQPIYD
ncbi:hypothetical protein ACQU0X_01290 [Pseudovibrio ascidiaceicola]|uniref:hypothetical protein n=1 Tax=Pseudovibrio ascidiaceicola TaxID=285279 RepID=UPI003D3632AB